MPASSDDDIHDERRWHADWFGQHRAYRVNRALGELKLQLQALMATRSRGGSERSAFVEKLAFDAVILQPERMQSGRIVLPGQNFTLVSPLDKDAGAKIMADEVVFSRLLELRADLKKFMKREERLIEELFREDFEKQVAADFEKLPPRNEFAAKKHAEIVRVCFDHCVGLLTRLPADNPIHNAISVHYFDSEDQKARNPLYWIEINSYKNRRGKIFGDTVAYSFSECEAAASGALRIPEGFQCKRFMPEPNRVTDDEFFLKDLRALVGEKDREKQGRPKRDIASIPVHTMHRWGTRSFGTFIGWLHVFFEVRDDNADLRTAEALAEKKEVLKLLWPLLDAFSLDFLEGEIQDFLGNYHSRDYETALDGFIDGIPRISGWEVVPMPEGVSHLEFDHFIFDQNTQCLGLRISDIDESAHERSLWLKPKVTTFIHRKEDDNPSRFGIGRMVSGLRDAYRRLVAVHAQTESGRITQISRDLSHEVRNHAEAFHAKLQLLSLKQDIHDDLSARIDIMGLAANAVFDDLDRKREMVSKQIETIVEPYNRLKDFKFGKVSFDAEELAVKAPVAFSLALNEMLRNAWKHSQYEEDALKRPTLEASCKSGVVVLEVSNRCEPEERNIVMDALNVPNSDDALCRLRELAGRLKRGRVYAIPTKHGVRVVLEMTITYETLDIDR